MGLVVTTKPIMLFHSNLSLVGGSLSSGASDIRGWAHRLSIAILSVTDRKDICYNFYCVVGI